jgi:hypothetical protein
MKGNIMDKKILLGGAAALLLVGNMYATPANAAIDLSIGGEAKLTAGMSECGPAAVEEDVINVLDRLDTDNSVADDADGATVGAALEAINTGMTAGTYDLAADLAINQAAGPCAGADRAGIDWGFSKKLSISASGTLANGLEVSFSDDLKLNTITAEEASFDLTLGGAFGSLQFKDGAPSAVDAAMVTGKKDLDVNGTDLGAHATETAGSAGMGVLWTAPGMGALDLYVGWAPNSGGNGLDTADYENTFSVGAVMDAAGMTVGAGYEAATANSATACDPDNTVKATGRDFALEAFGGKLCGDQTLMYIGATMDAADIGFSVGYSNLETDGGDKAVLSIGASTTVSDYDVSIDYRQNTLDYQYNDVQDTQSVVAFGLGTSLGDGVDLGLSFSTSDADIQAMPASTNYYFAEASLTVGF